MIEKIKEFRGRTLKIGLIVVLIAVIAAVAFTSVTAFAANHSAATSNASVPAATNKEDIWKQMPYYNGMPRDYNHMPWDTNNKVSPSLLGRGQ